MLNFNGELFNDDEKILDGNNRGLQFGDAVFEEIRVVNGDVYFLEEHYLRLMSSMRILRMEIPMQFTLEFMQAEILKTLSKQNSNSANSVKFTVFRNNGCKTTLADHDVSFIISACNLESPFFTMDHSPFEVELFKDFHKNKGMLSNLDTNNKILNVVGRIYAQENGYQDCLLLNEDKMVVEALSGNIFLIKDQTIKTPPLKDGCLNRVLRRKFMDVILTLEGYDLLEESISPFELQKADELFILNSIYGIIPVTMYRKKKYTQGIAKDLLGKLNAYARMGLNKND